MSQWIALPMNPGNASDANTYPPWVLYVAALVIILTLCAVLWFLFVLKDRTRVQYRIIIILLFFSLSSVTSLLFALNADIHGNIGLLTISISGPAALWFAGVLLFSKLFPEERAFPPPVHSDWTTLHGFTRLLNESDRGAGWTKYGEWRTQVSDRYPVLFELGNEDFIRKNLLDSACVTHGKKRIDKVAIHSAFLYFHDVEGPSAKGFVLKVQRIVGRKADQDPAFIRFSSNPSFERKVPEAVFLDGRRRAGRLTVQGAFTDRDKEGERKQGFHAVNHEQVDCCIIAGYYDYPTGGEDYILVDLERFSSTNVGELAVSMYVQHDITECDVYTMKRSLFFPEDDAPLSFFHHDVDASAGDNDLSKPLGEWLAALDESISGHGGHNIDEEALETLTRIRTEIAKRAKPPPGIIMSDTRLFSDMTKLFEPSRIRSFRMREAHNVLLTFVKW